MPQHSHARGVQLSLLCLLILGLLPIIATLRNGEGNAMAFSFWLSFWQLVFAVPVYLLQGRTPQPAPEAHASKPHFSKGRTWALVLLTGTLFGAATFVYVLAVDRAGPVTFAVAVQAYPLFAVVWEAFFLKRRKSMAEIGLMLVIAAAMVYLGTQGTWQLSAITGGFWLALVVPLLWSIAHVIIKEMMNASAITPSEVIVTRVLIATVLLGAASVWNQGLDGLVATATAPRFQGIAFLMGCAYYLELLSWFYAVKLIDVSRGASITAPAPALTLLISLAVLGQEVHGYQVVALVLVVGSVIGLIHSGHRRASTTP
ncbi:DMT family transporter [Rhodoferax sp. GW822-FHT02A01]|uniref:DMT family transporter n=1 Tax=Rhodoferax sp. GW822-FHT02A01 TaxID=3141537 RepID=UPI00315CED77